MSDPISTNCVTFPKLCSLDLPRRFPISTNCVHFPELCSLDLPRRFPSMWDKITTTITGLMKQIKLNEGYDFAKKQFDKGYVFAKDQLNEGYKLIENNPQIAAAAGGVIGVTSIAAAAIAFKQGRNKAALVALTIGLASGISAAVYGAPRAISIPKAWF